MNDPVSAWLESLGLEQYREIFQQNAITWDLLPELTDEDLTSLGVLLGHRKKLLRTIGRLSQSGKGDRAVPPPVVADYETALFPARRGRLSRGCTRPTPAGFAPQREWVTPPSVCSSLRLT